MKLPRFEVVRSKGSSFNRPAELKGIWERFEPAEESVFKRLLVLLKAVLSKIALCEVACGSMNVNPDFQNRLSELVTYQECTISQHMRRTNLLVQLLLRNLRVILVIHPPA